VGTGIYELTVGALDTTLTRLATLDLRSDLHLDLELFRMTATGAVVDGSNGAPIEGAEVFVVVEGGPSPGQDERTSVVSGRDGAFQVVALVPSTARLLIRRAGYQPVEVGVGPGAWSGLYIRLSPIATPP
jgi:hypothetical protein